MTTKPLVSIAIPVYNGEEYLAQALDSLLAQDYENIEFLISDNASTDSTEEICRQYVTRDARIHYHRNSENIGAVNNFIQAVTMVSGHYFMWAANDDIWSPNYVSVLAERLASCPGAMLSAGKTIFVGPKGEALERSSDEAPPSLPTPEMLMAIFVKTASTCWICGLYDRAQLVQLMPKWRNWSHMAASDVILTVHLCLNYPIVGSNEALLYKRVGKGREWAEEAPDRMWLRKTPRQRVRWQRQFTPLFLATILRAPVSASERARLIKMSIPYLKRYVFKGYSPKRIFILWSKALLHTFKGTERR